MLTRWKKQQQKLGPKVPGAAYFAARRKRLSALFPGELLIVPTGHEKTRANDTCYPFRPGSDFYYLTGNLEPDCVLVLVPRPSGAQGHDSVLFVEPNLGRSDITFFTDRVKGELWVGPRLGIVQSHHRFGTERCLPLPALAEHLAAWRGPAPTPPGRAGKDGATARPYRVVRGHDAALEALLQAPAGRAVPKAQAAQATRDHALAEALGEMRLVKDAHELRALTRACVSTARGFDDVIARLRTGQSEREVEGVFNLRARMEGNAVGYNTIAAAGQHACVLHWQHNNGGLKQDELLLLDAGVEGHELYTADVTRTLPICGQFSPAQSDIYDLVLAAQKAAFAAVRPGLDFMEPNARAMRVLAHGLAELGILADAEEALKPENQTYKRYTLHMVSHMLGIDVHDCAEARAQTYKYGTLVPGMVLTVEPGLYLQKDDLTVPARYRGIGVRIEDDVVVTQRGMRILSKLPRERRQVEAWMQQIWRNADKAHTSRQKSGRRPGPRSKG